MRQAKSFFDESKKPLKNKIAKAIKFYTEKYGESPDECQVNPAMLDGTERKVKIKVNTYHYLTPGTLLVGINDSRMFGTKRRK
jgi:hypothetical protein